MRRAACGMVMAVGIGCVAPPAAAQFADPCELGCVAVLGATSFVTATGVSVAAGRFTGGLTSMDQGLLLWGLSFAATAGGGIALSGNGERQERAVYASGLGALGGALAGGLLGSALGGDEAHLFSGTLMGAAAGALVGGAIGALTWSGTDGGGAMPLVSLRLEL